MTPIEQLSALVDRLERTDAGDRALDMAVRLAIGMPAEFMGQHVTKWLEGGECLHCLTDNGVMHLEAVGLANFTTSVDAAAAVAGADVYWEVSGPRKYLNIPSPVPNRWQAQLRFGSSPRPGLVVSWAATEALARSAAGLRKKIMELEHVDAAVAASG